LDINLCTLLAIQFRSASFQDTITPPPTMASSTTCISPLQAAEQAIASFDKPNAQWTPSQRTALAFYRANAMTFTASFSQRDLAYGPRLLEYLGRTFFLGKSNATYIDCLQAGIGDALGKTSGGVRTPATISIARDMPLVPEDIDIGHTIQNVTVHEEAHQYFRQSCCGV
jgi:hypothetical protein